MDKRVKAIREDKLVGEGTCSVVDECYGEEEILESLAAERVTTEKGAVRWAIRVEAVQQEKRLNESWGEDKDESHLAYTEWRERVAKYRKGKVA